MKTRVKPGDTVRLTMPHSEVCMHMRIAGQERNVLVLATMAQILNEDGSHFSIPVTHGEAGLFRDADGLYLVPPELGDDFVSKVLESAITTMLWCQTFDCDGETLEHEAGEFENSARHLALRELVTEATIEALREDVVRFLTSNALDVRKLDPAQVGHDFILTRNHHGSGFWDRGLGLQGQRLTEASDRVGELTWYQGEPGDPIEL